MSCPAYPVPSGWRVWRGPVPPQLTDAAIEVRDHIRRYPYGSIPKTIPWTDSQGNDITVGTWVNPHTWTYKNGQLITGICIPGVTLVTHSFDPVNQVPDDIGTPDPNAAMYPAESIDWLTVGLSALAGAAVVGGFLFVTKTSPKKHVARALERMR